jgi:hypothetical protein
MNEVAISKSSFTRARIRSPKVKKNITKSFVDALLRPGRSAAAKMLAALKETGNSIVCRQPIDLCTNVKCAPGLFFSHRFELAIFQLCQTT